MTASAREEISTPSPPTTRPVVAMMLYHGMTLLDLVGPHMAMARLMEIHLVAADLSEIATDSGLPLKPTTTFADCPSDLDVLFVPGGSGVPTGPGQVHVLDDETLLAFVADRGADARHVTSVCTGALVHGAAGLLQGYRATTHWASQHLLPLFGAQPSDERVVEDRNRMTGGGVTAGLDFGLVLVADMMGEDVARLTQLAMEYDPQPPFDSGSPRTADPVLVQQMRLFNREADAIVTRVGKAFAARHRKDSVPAKD